MCQGLASCITGSFRLLMFFGSLLLGIVAVGLAAVVSWVRLFYADLGELDWKHNLTYLFICAVYLIVLTVAGSLGAFFNNKKIIHFFCLMLAVNILVCLVILIYMPGQEDSQVKFTNKLESSLNKYSFKKFNTTQEETSNQFWDKLQTEQRCCGLKEPQDWQPFSPEHKYYPKSCCKNFTTRADEQFCETSDTRMGCLQVLYAPLFLVFLTLLWAMILSIPLALIACISSCGAN